MNPRINHRDDGSMHDSSAPVQAVASRWIPASIRAGAFWAGTAWLTLVMITSAYAGDETAKGEPPSDAKPAPLSVAPLDHIEYPSNRPKWLDRQPDLSSAKHSIVVVSSPWETDEEAAEELAWMQKAAISTYVCGLIDEPCSPDFYPIDQQEIDDDLIVQRYRGTVVQGDTTKYERAVELVFSESKRETIRDAWKNREVGRRLGALGGLASIGLVLLMGTSGLIGIVARRFS